MNCHICSWLLEEGEEIFDFLNNLFLWLCFLVFVVLQVIDTLMEAVKCTNQQAFHFANIVDKKVRWRFFMWFHSWYRLRFIFSYDFGNIFIESVCKWHKEKKLEVLCNPEIGVVNNIRFPFIMFQGRSAVFTGSFEQCGKVVSSCKVCVFLYIYV